MTIKEINVESIVRSVAIIAIGLPASIGIGNFFSGVEETAHELGHATVHILEGGESNHVQNRIKGEVAEDCLDWFFSEKDSSVERAAKDSLDQRFGGKVDYENMCDWAIN